VTSSEEMSTGVKLYIVRHADAGNRSAWTGDDDLRPLGKKGRRQAAGLADLLARTHLTRLVSSPSVRCLQTLEPLAKHTGLPIEPDRRLAEGSRGDEALALAHEMAAVDDVGLLCSHGDVIPDLLSELKIAGTRFHHELTWPKASTWVLSGNGTLWTDARFLPTP
jgi:broad specificity phosphatase PhoE